MTTPVQIDLNCDLGESFGPYVLGDDGTLLDSITSANIACGCHAGDPMVMARTVILASDKGVGIGAHPGLPDRQGFGRRVMALDPEEIYTLMLYQMGALSAFATVQGQWLQHVKPHGALYTMAEDSDEVASAIAQAVLDFAPQLILFGLSGGRLVETGERLGLRVAREVFADRTYQPDGTLTPRDQPNALITDPDSSLRQTVQIVTEGRVRTANGTEIALTADTVCVHGDTPGAAQMARALVRGLTEHGIRIKRIGQP